MERGQGVTVFLEKEMLSTIWGHYKKLQQWVLKLGVACKKAYTKTNCVQHLSTNHKQSLLLT